jgi:hypothetical protein
MGLHQLYNLISNKWDTLMIMQDEMEITQDEFVFYLKEIDWENWGVHEAQSS